MRYIVMMIFVMAVLAECTHVQLKKIKSRYRHEEVKDSLKHYKERIKQLEIERLKPIY